MVVAIQKGLEGIKGKLQERGYRVVYYDEYYHPIDAYVYIGYTGDGVFENMTNVTSMSLSHVNHGHESKNSGVLLINALNKNLNQIDYMLKSRCYSKII